jgi:hypothetical protein
MKSKLLTVFIAGILFIMPTINFGQAPDLGAASSFALFTAAGAFSTEVGDVSTVTGDVGTNVGAFYGFPPGTLIGQKHVADAISAQAAPDVLAAYGFMEGITCGIYLSGTLGNGTILTPNVYCKGDASTLNGTLILDGQGDPDALFIFKIGGAFATSTNTTISLINSASLCNVYWQINGAFTLGEGSVFRGTVLANGAIHLLQGSSLLGSGLSTAGAIDLHNNVVTLGMQTVASVITAGGPTLICLGDSVMLSGNNGGLWNNGSSAPSLSVKTSGDYFVTNTNECGSATSNHITVTVIDCQATPIPISTWAIVLGGVLITLFAFFRYRRFI